MRLVSARRHTLSTKIPAGRRVGSRARAVTKRVADPPYTSHFEPMSSEARYRGLNARGAPCHASACRVLPGFDAAGRPSTLPQALLLNGPRSRGRTLGSDSTGIFMALPHFRVSGLKLFFLGWYKQRRRAAPECTVLVCICLSCPQTRTSAVFGRPNCSQSACRPARLSGLGTVPVQADPNARPTVRWLEVVWHLRRRVQFDSCVHT